jgi:hypothetical protein
MSAITYEFAVLRYTPNLVREEFTNIGIVMYVHITGGFHYKLLTPLSPSLPPIPGMQMVEVKVLLERLNVHFADVKENIEDLCLERYEMLPVALGSIEPIQRILKRQDATLSWSPLKTGIHPDDPPERLDSLFRELIEPVPILFVPTQLPVKL